VVDGEEHPLRLFSRGLLLCAVCARGRDHFRGLLLFLRLLLLCGCLALDLGLLLPALGDAGVRQVLLGDTLLGCGLVRLLRCVSSAFRHSW
jgi:hypothetical protein